MKPDEKYMSETSSKEENKRFNFIPPSFNRSLLINDSTDEDSNNFLDLFPSETNKSELFCYYSSFSDCDDKNMKAINNLNTSNKGYSNNNNPNYNNNNSGYSNNNNPNYNNNNSGYSNNNPNYNNKNGYSNNNNPNYNNKNGYSNNTPNSNNNPNYSNQNRNPSTFDILRDFDLDLDETTDFQRNEDTNTVNKIFSEIQTKHSGILDTLTTYNIPSPISNIIVKRLIKLSLLYSDEK